MINYHSTTSGGSGKMVWAWPSLTFSLNTGKAKETLFLMFSADTLSTRTFHKAMMLYLQRTVLSLSWLLQPQLMYRTIPQNIFMKHLTIPWLVYTLHVLFHKLIAYTQFVSLLFLRELNVHESLSSKLQLQACRRPHKSVNHKRLHLQPVIFKILKIWNL